MMKPIPDPHPSERMILLSGARGSGKTTLIQKALVPLQNKGVDIAGILSLPVMENDKKVAINALDLRSGKTRRLAKRNPGVQGDLATGQWLFDPQVIQWADGILKAGTPCDLLVVDELGVLEFERNRGWLAGLKALDLGRFAAAIAVIRPELLEKARNRWPLAAVLEVKAANRTSALNGLETLLAGLLQPHALK